MGLFRGYGGIAILVAATVSFAKIAAFIPRSSVGLRGRGAFGIGALVP